MPRVVSLFLPSWSTDRVRRNLGDAAPPVETPLVLDWPRGKATGGAGGGRRRAAGGVARGDGGDQGAGAGLQPHRSWTRSRRPTRRRSIGWRSGRCSAMRRSSRRIRRMDWSSTRPAPPIFTAVKAPWLRGWSSDLPPPASPRAPRSPIAGAAPMPSPAIWRDRRSSLRRAKPRRQFSTCRSPPCACPGRWWKAFASSASNASASWRQNPARL